MRHAKSPSMGGICVGAMMAAIKASPTTTAQQ